MAVGGFLNILNDQLTEIASGENDGQATAASEGVAFEILGKMDIDGERDNERTPILIYRTRIIEKMF